MLNKPRHTLNLDVRSYDSSVWNMGQVFTHPNIRYADTSLMKFILKGMDMNVIENSYRMTLQEFVADDNFRVNTLAYVPEDASVPTTYNFSVDPSKKSFNYDLFDDCDLGLYNWFINVSTNVPLWTVNPDSSITCNPLSGGPGVTQVYVSPNDWLMAGWVEQIIFTPFCTPPLNPITVNVTQLPTGQSCTGGSTADPSNFGLNVYVKNFIYDGRYDCDLSNSWHVHVSTNTYWTSSHNAGLLYMNPTSGWGNTTVTVQPQAWRPTPDWQVTVYFKVTGMSDTLLECNQLGTGQVCP